MTAGQTCGNCRFSLPATDGKGAINFKTRFCRRAPPSVVMIPTPQGPQYVAMWPTLGSGDHCFSWEGGVFELPLPGETKPKPEPKADA